MTVVDLNSVKDPGGDVRALTMRLDARARAS